MSVLVYIDHAEGHIKKASFEALTYGADLARQLGIPAWASMEYPGFTRLTSQVLTSWMFKIWSKHSQKRQ